MRRSVIKIFEDFAGEGIFSMRNENNIFLIMDPFLEDY